MFPSTEELMHRRQEEFGYLDLEDIVDDDGDPERNGTFATSNHHSLIPNTHIFTNIVTAKTNEHFPFVP